ncbi:hypothetical protein TREMEDRAFT_64963 [Tremella mesenterica DSM 1558]|uniref:uncharacterized protein n=1 Tax=Tremella mesenterica (strain ATCC 24925 / CBS 8224 / DSM 1558 / NBRC 9311 / NRRL Y-6157 / RJB 2259-6 / UBC 559-6) TaxID=578456 RepID=UPI0003F4A219|nr:uncharacterized protein TREMEDRAFT_64963 [Tremella mesenterica DSM 1558]EIW67094.1 hypothetical protein TREMEDRAFT_64963 [Tremella mesenterica DSM 1558]
MSPKLMNLLDASRIQSTQAKRGKDMSSKGFAARAQRAAAKNYPGVGEVIGVAQNGWALYTCLGGPLSFIAAILGLLGMGFFHRDKFADPNWQAEQAETIEQMFNMTKEVIQSAPEMMEETKRHVDQVVEVVKQIPFAEIANTIKDTVLDPTKDTLKAQAVEGIEKLKTIPMGDIANAVKDMGQKTVVHVAGHAAGFTKGLFGMIKNMGVEDL